MANRKNSFVEGEYYHIFNRGNSRQKIFLDKKDYEHFIKCLFICNSEINFKFRDHIVEKNIDAFDFDRGETLVNIGAWVLMPNHFHLYITINPHRSDLWEKTGKNSISEYMRKLSTAYVTYFNKRHGRSGGLFEGAFKSVQIENDNQAKYLFSYIHLNPIKLIDSTWKINGIKDIKSAIKFLNDYSWSSYRDYQKVIRRENKIIDLSNFPEYFSNIDDFDQEILDWIFPQVRPVGQ